MMSELQNDTYAAYTHKDMYGYVCQYQTWNVSAYCRN